MLFDFREGKIGEDFVNGLSRALKELVGLQPAEMWGPPILRLEGRAK